MLIMWPRFRARLVEKTAHNKCHITLHLIIIILLCNSRIVLAFVNNEPELFKFHVDSHADEQTDKRVGRPT